MDQRKVFNRFLTDEDLNTLAQVTADAYRACDLFMEKSPVFSAFQVGNEHRSYMLGIFEQYALLHVPVMREGFTYEIRRNAANNCSHVRLFKDGKFGITAHFVGQRNFRESARPAIYRATLASVNGDLFDDDPASNEMDADVNTGSGYCQLLHGGVNKPEVIVLMIPIYNQRKSAAVLELPCPEPNLTQAEKIEDQVNVMLREQVHELSEPDNFSNAG